MVRYTDRRPFVIRVNDAGTDLAGLVPPPQPAEAADAGEAREGEPAAETSLDPGDAPVGGGAGSAD